MSLAVTLPAPPGPSLDSGLLPGDFYSYQDLLSAPEREVVGRLRDFLPIEVAPIVNDHWTRAEFPFQLFEGFAKLELLRWADPPQPLAHWREVLDRARITYGVIQSPEEAARDPQLRPNDIVVPLEGDDALQEIISSPITVGGVPKPPDLGDHNEQILKELGFSDGEILFAQGNLTGIAYAELPAQGR